MGGSRPNLTQQTGGTSAGFTVLKRHVTYLVSFGLWVEYCRMFHDTIQVPIASLRRRDWL